MFTKCCFCNLLSVAVAVIIRTKPLRSMPHFRVASKTDVHKAGFSDVRKIPDDRGFYFLPTITDFADISDIRQRSVPDFPDSYHSLRETPGAQQFKELEMSEIHCRRTPMVQI